MYSLCPYTCTGPDSVRIRIYDCHYYLLNCFHISIPCPYLYVTSVLIATCSDSTIDIRAGSTELIRQSDRQKTTNRHASRGGGGYSLRLYKIYVYVYGLTMYIWKQSFNLCIPPRNGWLSSINREIYKILPYQ